MTKIIVGLYGPQRAGKDTVCGILASEFGYEVISISQMIQDECYRIFGVRYWDEEKDEPREELNGHTPRDLFIAVGKLERFNLGLWADRVMQVVMETPRAFFAVPSIGRQCQWDRILEICGWTRLASAQEFPHPVLAFVSRPGFENWDSREPIADRLDAYSIRNQGNLEDLRQEVIEFHARLLREEFGASRRGWMLDTRWLEERGYRCRPWIPKGRI